MIIGFLQCQHSSVQLVLKEKWIEICRLNEILPQFIKEKSSLLGSFLCGSLLSYLSTVSAEYTVSGFIRYRPRSACMRPSFAFTLAT